MGLSKADWTDCREAVAGTHCPAQGLASLLPHQREGRKIEGEGQGWNEEGKQAEGQRREEEKEAEGQAASEYHLSSNGPQDRDLVHRGSQDFGRGEAWGHGSGSLGFYLSGVGQALKGGIGSKSGFYKEKPASSPAHLQCDTFSMGGHSQKAAL